MREINIFIIISYLLALALGFCFGISTHFNDRLEEAKQPLKKGKTYYIIVTEQPKIYERVWGIK
jgi:hypothetical protein